MKRSITALTLLLSVLVLAAAAQRAPAKPPKRARGAAEKAPKVEPLPVLEVVAHTEMKTTAEHKEAYAAALAKAGRDAFYTLHPVERIYQEKLEDGTADYRLEIVHKGEIIVGKTISVHRSAIANLVAKDGDIIQHDAGYEVEWTYPVDQNGTIQYRLLKWERKDAGYKELLSWQNRQSNRAVFYAAKVFVMKAPPPPGTQLKDGEKIIVANGIPAMPVTPAELADEKKAAAESILPIETRREIQTALCPCTLLNASAAKRDIRGRHWRRFRPRPSHQQNAFYDFGHRSAGSLHAGCAQIPGYPRGRICRTRQVADSRTQPAPWQRCYHSSVGEESCSSGADHRCRPHQVRNPLSFQLESRLSNEKDKLC